MAGAQQTVWEILTEMERFDGKVTEGEQGEVALVLDLATEPSVEASLKDLTRGLRLF